MQIGAIGQQRLQQFSPVTGGDQDAHIAIAQNIGDLFGFQQRIDGNEYPTGQSGAKQGGDGFQPLGQIHGDPFRPAQTQRQQTPRGALHQTSQIGVIYRHLPVDDGGGFRATIRLFENQFVQQSGHTRFRDLSSGGWFAVGITSIEGKT